MLKLENRTGTKKKSLTQKPTEFEFLNILQKKLKSF